MSGSSSTAAGERTAALREELRAAREAWKVEMRAVDEAEAKMEKAMQKHQRLLILLYQEKEAETSRIAAMQPNTIKKGAQATQSEEGGFEVAYLDLVDEVLEQRKYQGWGELLLSGVDFAEEQEMRAKREDAGYFF